MSRDYAFPGGFLHCTLCDRHWFTGGDLETELNRHMEEAHGRAAGALLALSRLGLWMWMEALARETHGPTIHTCRRYVLGHAVGRGLLRLEYGR